jgi:hypothetical protein
VDVVRSAIIIISIMGKKFLLGEKLAGLIGRKIASRPEAKRLM